MREWEGSRIPLIQREDPTVRWTKAVPGFLTNSSDVAGEKKLSWSCLIAFFLYVLGLKVAPLPWVFRVSIAQPCLPA